MSQPLYIASRNAGKVRELTDFLRNLGFEPHLATELDPKIEWVEDGLTFVDNARIKARTLRQFTSAAVLADDSGLCVDILNGGPGVDTAIFAGTNVPADAHWRKLLHIMQDVPEGQRGAHFICTLVLVDARGQEYCFSGQCQGRIALAPHGNQGFGYDPVFIPEGYQQTFGELNDTVKAKISHRALAMKALQEALQPKA